MQMSRCPWCKETFEWRTDLMHHRFTIHYFDEMESEYRQEFVEA